MKWATKTLGDICEITSSRRIFAHEYVSDGVPFYRGKEVVEKFNGAQALSTELFISRNRFEEIADKHGAPREGDILLTSVGTLGVPYLVGPGEEFYFKDGNLTWFRPGKESDSAFLYYWLLTPQGRAELGKSTIGTSQSAYTIELLKRMQISLPAVAEQAELASTLSAYDDLIENNRRRKALLEESARLLYREWFVRLRFPGHEHTRIVDGVPEGWGRKTLGALCSEIRETVSPDTLEPDTPYIGLEHMPRRSISLNDWGKVEQVTSSKHRFRAGEILFGKIRPYFHKVGVAFVGGVASSDAIVIRPVDEQLHGLVLMTVSSDEFVAVTSQAMKEGSKMPRADWRQMQAYSVPLPSSGLLSTFDSVIQPIVDQLKALTFANQKLRAARDLLLPRLMSGEITV
jgi:type I restriction enzyme S subunit